MPDARTGRRVVVRQKLDEHRLEDPRLDAGEVLLTVGGVEVVEEGGGGCEEGEGLRESLRVESVRTAH